MKFQQKICFYFQNSSLSSSIHHDQSISPLQSNHVNNRDKLINSSGNTTNSTLSGSLNNRTTNPIDSVYVHLQSQRLNSQNYSSENNLVNPNSLVMDRINSTSRFHSPHSFD